MLGNNSLWQNSHIFEPYMVDIALPWPNSQQRYFRMAASILQFWGPRLGQPESFLLRHGSVIVPIEANRMFTSKNSAYCDVLGCLF